MENIGKTTTMAESVKPIKISEKEFERLQKFGVAGESINTALKRVLVIAEKHRKK